MPERYDVRMSLADKNDDSRYRALLARDARFDGVFFVGVRSTRIYCRPVCKVRTPGRVGCTFFDLPAQAEAAGFRPCLRCRPELAPRALRHYSYTDSVQILAHQAVEFIESSPQVPSAAAVAARLGVSDRHMRRIFAAELGVSPLQYVQTRRLLIAKALLSDTALPIITVAQLSGFGSLRRFNDAFLQAYRLPPNTLRKTLKSDTSAICAPIKLGFRPPFDVARMLQFFQARALKGLESISEADGLWRMGRSLSVTDSAQKTRCGWLEVAWQTGTTVMQLRLSTELHPALPKVVQLVRGWLDIDADPAAIEPVLAADFPGQAGIRVPGCLDGFELGVRAILGQQVSVAAARTFAQRLLDQFGTDIQTPMPGVQRLFPDAARIAALNAEDLGALGIVKQRQQALLGLARAVCAGLVLSADASSAQNISALEAIPGIGTWTAQYIAMRALRWPDAFPAGDVALQKALGISLLERKKPAQAKRQAEALSQRWQPWRSYCVMRAWSNL
jgi:AraC family transcriptional regulator, regulatory protein of adaptative response / DNA-3-methyladenine glycosylase II